jgi:hypothetical protein
MTILVRQGEIPIICSISFVPAFRAYCGSKCVVLLFNTSHLNRLNLRCLRTMICRVSASIGTPSTLTVALALLSDRRIAHIRGFIAFFTCLTQVDSTPCQMIWLISAISVLGACEARATAPIAIERTTRRWITIAIVWERRLINVPLSAHNRLNAYCNRHTTEQYRFHAFDY